MTDHGISFQQAKETRLEGALKWLKYHKSLTMAVIGVCSPFLVWLETWNRVRHTILYSNLPNFSKALITNFLVSSRFSVSI